MQKSPRRLAFSKLHLKNKGPGPMRPEYCLAEDEDIPCACGASKEGKDPVRGVCQARHCRPPPRPFLHLDLIDKDTGDVVARTTAYH